MIKAKFKCKQLNTHENAQEVLFVPELLDVSSGENKEFHENTPAGKLELVVTNKELFGTFKPGSQYYISLESAPDEVAKEPEVAPKTEVAA